MCNARTDMLARYVPNVNLSFYINLTIASDFTLSNSSVFDRKRLSGVCWLVLSWDFVDAHSPEVLPNFWSLVLHDSSPHRSAPSYSWAFDLPCNCNDLFARGASSKVGKCFGRLGGGFVFISHQSVPTPWIDGDSNVNACKVMFFALDSISLNWNVKYTADRST